MTEKIFDEKKKFFDEIFFSQKLKKKKLKKLNFETENFEIRTQNRAASSKIWFSSDFIVRIKISQNGPVPKKLPHNRYMAPEKLL